MAEFLDEKRREIDARLSELKPLVDQYARLQAAAATLDGLPVAAASPAPTRRRAVRHASPADARRTAGTHAKRGRPNGTATRAKQALELVQANPGITIPEMAEKIGIKQNYLYRVLPGLANEGLVTKDGRGWRPKAAA